MKFRILDLVIVTACIAVLFAVFPIDLTFFRQLLFLSLVAATSFLLCSLPRERPHITAKGAIGGAFATSIYGAVLVLFFDQVTEQPVFEPEPGSLSAFLSSFLGELIVCTTLAPVFGAAIGPLLHSHRLTNELSDRQRTLRKWSWILFAATLILLFFMMLDRVQFAGLGRNWGSVAILVFAVFIVLTVGWTSAMHAAKNDAPEIARDLQSND
ncbi:MAG: hypothetical protein AAF456_18405 [Planctomycetota bacterium]